MVLPEALPVTGEGGPRLGWNRNVRRVSAESTESLELDEHASSLSAGERGVCFMAIWYKYVCELFDSETETQKIQMERKSTTVPGLEMNAGSKCFPCEDCDPVAH